MIKKLGAAFFFALVFFLAYRFALRYYIGEAAEEAVDFPSYYYAAKLTFDLDLSPYNTASWNIAEHQYEQGKLFPFLYPPPSLLFFRLFNLFNYETAKLIMLGLNHILALIFLFLFFFGVLRLKPYALLPMLGAVYLYNFFPLVLTIYTGQVNLLILILICLAWMGTKEKWHPALVALPLSLGILLKLYPILFLVVLFFRREYKAIIYTLAFTVFFSIIVSPFLPAATWADWAENVLSKGYLAQDVLGLAIAKPANQSINAFLLRTFFGLNIRFEALLTPPEWLVRISPFVICGFIGIVSLTITWYSTHKNKFESIDLLFPLWLITMFLIAPISWDHHLVLILPAIFIAFLESIQRKWLWSLPILLGLAYFLATNFDFNNPVFREGWKMLLISAKMAAVLLLWFFFVGLSYFKKRGN